MLQTFHKGKQALLLLGGELGKGNDQFILAAGLSEKFLEGDIHGITQKLQMPNGDVRFAQLYPAQMGLGNTGSFGKTVLGIAALCPQADESFADVHSCAS